MRGLMNSYPSTKWSFWFSRALLCSSVVLSNFPNFVSSSDNTTTTAPPYSTPSPNRTVFSCKWEDLKFPISYGSAIACGLSIIIGGIELFVGFKYLRTSLFLTGFSGGAILTYFICMEKSSLGLQYILLITVAIGIFVGILCTTVVFCGLFSSGIAAGFCISMAFLLGFSSLYEDYDTISIPIGAIISVSVIFAGISVWWKRFLIVTSSIFGSAMIMGGADYFIEDLWILKYSLKKVFLTTVYGELCMVTGILLGSWPLLMLIGLLVQFLKTAKKPAGRPKKDTYDKRYTTGSPFYSAPDLVDAEDIEMAELIPQNTASHESNPTNSQTHKITDV